MRLVASEAAGKLLAWTLASQGKRLAVIGRQDVEGPAATSRASRLRLKVGRGLLGPDTDVQEAPGRLLG